MKNLFGKGKSFKWTCLRDEKSNVYHAKDYWNASKLKDLKYGPIYFKFKYLTNSIPNKSSTELRRGSYFHTLLLEHPQNAIDDYIVSTAKTATAKEYIKLVEENPTKIILTQKEADEAIAMKNLALDDARFNFILNLESQNEVSYYLEDVIYDNKSFKFKFRPDLVFKNSIFDLKTTSAINVLDEHQVYYHIKTYGYHISAAFYIQLYSLITDIRLEDIPFYLMFVSSGIPQCQIYRLSEEFINLGMQELNKLFNLYDEYNLNEFKPRITDDWIDGVPVINVRDYDGDL